jgi:hypothetical protein
MLRAVSTFTFATLMAACVASPDDRAQALNSNATATAPTITFAADWTQTTSAPLVAGGSATIAYDLSRASTACEGESNNMDVWGESGFALFDDGTETSFSVSNLVGGVTTPTDATIAVPAAAASVQLWFETNNIWGCAAYDSDTVDFGADWSFTQTGPVHAGDQVVVHYDPDRLNQCYALSNEQPAWNITLYWQVDGGAITDVAADVPDGADLAPADPIISVPPGHDLAMWFEATSIYGCQAWDSDYGSNYHVAIAP